jgi:hypothetical protein
METDATVLPPGRRSTSSVGGLAAAAAAAVAAVLVLALTACASTQVGPIPPCGPGLTVEPSGWAGDPGTIASYVASGLIPRYYVAAGGVGDALVQATATGETLATIRPPTSGAEIVAVSGAADDRTFAIETQGRYNAPGIRFYLFRLSSSGRPGTLTQLPVSVPVASGETVTGISLSPDADELAVSFSGPASQESSIKVYALATGAVRTWTTSSSPSEILPGMTLAWTRDERTLSFPWYPGTGPAARLLSLAAPGGDLLKASRAARTGADCTQVAPVITPDGKTIACGAQRSPAESATASQGDQDGQQDQVLSGFAEYNAADGAPEGVLGGQQSLGHGPVLWWENTSGSVLIGGIAAPFQSCPIAEPLTVGVFTADRYIALPGMPELFITSFAW